MVPMAELLVPQLVLVLCSLELSRGATRNDCPSACFCDAEGQYVSCVGDGTWRVPQDLPGSSERLELRNFAVDVLAPRVLEGVAALRELKLQQSQTRRVEDGALSTLALLQRLDLSQNLLENLTSGSFRGLQQLKYLDLSSNQLVHVDGAFADLGNLEQLNLRGNLLTQLSTYTFTGLHRIQYLNLDSNLISSLEVGAFQYLANLAHLILSNNPLTVPYIDASHVGLERVPQSLTRYVRDLRLGRNNITRINLGDLDSYPHLGLLVLDDNAIEDVEDDALGRQEYLARLWLNGNRLTRIPLNLPPMLVALYIEENSIEELPPNSFPGLSNLEQLFLQRNQIRTIADCAFCDLSKLKTLDLQANQIEVLSSEAFRNLSSLVLLDVSQNPIRMLEPHCFRGLERLQTLQMSRLTRSIDFEEPVFDDLKNLTKLEMYDSAELVAKVINSSGALHGLRNIQELNLMHNKLSSLRPDFPSFFPKLRVLKVGGNNFDCGPEVQWFSQWIKTSSIKFYSSYSIRCASPPALQFKPIMLLGEDDFRESSTQEPANVTERSIAPTATPLATAAVENVGLTVDSTTVTNEPTLLQANHTQQPPSPTILLPQDSTSENASSVPLGVPRNLLFASAVAEKQQQGPVTLSKATITSTVVVGCGFLVLGCLLGNGVCVADTAPLPASSSISYRPQRDEVSILTVSEATLGVRTSAHQGIRNKLYYAMERNRNGPREATLEPHLQELIPRSLSDGAWSSGHASI
ncbi:hypothetical protein HPB47_024596 [Ixodes persulcatus]|uniref:Uncharacterized protein n=1 Tax=Ixodes persulcatus TaxID=34615 RepID=A0AC60Q3U3_IXOPE|nr:hypothetical protein HPB47_024596 [Ixodes persulcatus]